jgi:hypothetical protein
MNILLQADVNSAAPFDQQEADDDKIDLREIVPKIDPVRVLTHEHYIGKTIL